MIERMVQLLKRPCDPPIVAERVLEIDNDLRPEGRSGPMVRSLESYAEYYSRWADTWEFQALTRARPMAGSDLLAERFTELIDPYRYPAELTERQLNEIRRMKARVENERLPRGADPSRHVKLGRGGLSDVEWLVQTLQLQHAHQHPGLRTTSTLDGLEAAVQAELMDSEDAHALAKAWKLCTAIRNGNVLRTGRASGRCCPRRARTWRPSRGGAAIRRAAPSCSRMTTFAPRARPALSSSGCSTASEQTAPDRRRGPSSVRPSGPRVLSSS